MECTSNSRFDAIRSLMSITPISSIGELFAPQIGLSSVNGLIGILWASTHPNCTKDKAAPVSKTQYPVVISAYIEMCETSTLTVGK